MAAIDALRIQPARYIPGQSRGLPHSDAHEFRDAKRKKLPYAEHIVQRGIVPAMREHFNILRGGLHERKHGWNRADTILQSSEREYKRLLPEQARLKRQIKKWRNKIMPSQHKKHQEINKLKVKLDSVNERIHQALSNLNSRQTQVERRLRKNQR